MALPSFADFQAAEIGLCPHVGEGDAADTQRLGPRPVTLTVRPTAADGRGLSAAAAERRLTPSAWAAPLIRPRLQGRLTFARSEGVALIAIQTELRRVGVNVIRSRVL